MQQLAIVDHNILARAWSFLLLPLYDVEFVDIPLSCANSNSSVSRCDGSALTMLLFAGGQYLQCDILVWDESERIVWCYLQWEFFWKKSLKSKLINASDSGIVGVWTLTPFDSSLNSPVLPRACRYMAASLSLRVCWRSLFRNPNTPGILLKK